VPPFLSFSEINGEPVPVGWRYREPDAGKQTLSRTAESQVRRMARANMTFGTCFLFLEVSSGQSSRFGNGHYRSMPTRSGQAESHPTQPFVAAPKNDRFGKTVPLV
jgi:hypothetical protein